MSPNTYTCPKCQNREFDAAGTCLVCGARADADAAAEVQKEAKTEPGGHSGLIEMECSPPMPPDSAEIPEWRQELSRRLTEIRSRRGLDMESPAPSLPFPKPVGQDASQTSSPEAEPVETSAELARPALRRRPAVRVPEKPDLKPVRPARKIDAVMPLFVPEAKKPAIVAEPKLAAQDPVSEAGGTSPDKIQRIIDSAVARQSVVPVAGVETASLSSGLEVEHEDKLILLSRILSGLIDLLIIGLCTGAFILAADVFSGIDIIDNVSKFYYGALLLAIYFVYSAFFLGTANQTVGMMIKDLRIVGSEGGRPRMSHILGRCAAYLISWLSLGIGLLWAAFDRNALCFHDKLSHTRVVRL